MKIQILQHQLQLHLVMSWHLVLLTQGLAAEDYLLDVHCYSWEVGLSAIAGTELTEVKFKIILMELGMIYDMLYTKTMVLHSRTGIMLRCMALVAMVVAFVLLLANHHMNGQKGRNLTITYQLFLVAIHMEVLSILMVIASPWTRARFNLGTFLSWLSHILCFPFWSMPSTYMSQFNLADYSMSKKSMSKFISEVYEALGLEKHWRNFGISST